MGDSLKQMVQIPVSQDHSVARPSHVRTSVPRGVVRAWGAQVASFLKMLTTFISPQHGFKLEDEWDHAEARIRIATRCALSALFV